MRAWIEINLKNIEHNINYIKSLSNKEIFAVVKANAYGMGAKEITKFLYEIGIRNFAVANTLEAIEIRKIFHDIKILVLGSLCKEDFFDAEKNNLSLSISSLEELKFLKENKLNIKIQIKLNTGMNRIGFLEHELEEGLIYARENNIEIEGIFTHLSDAEKNNKDSEEFTIKQVNKFEEKVLLAKEIYGQDFSYIHILNSAGIIKYQNIRSGNYIRSGLCMYGYMGNKQIKELKGAFALKSKIILIKQIREDAYISYGRKATLKKGESYAVIGIGYADGVKRFLKNAYVICNNHKLEILGSICMDMIMVKLPTENISDFNLEDEVIIYNEEIINNIDLNENEYFSIWELMTGIGNRVKRVYIEE